MTPDQFSKASPNPLAKKYAAVLFDLDGTLIDSTEAIIAHWKSFGNEHEIDPALILATSHGRRSIDIVREWKPELANMEYICQIEAEIPKNNAAGVRELPGARSLISTLQETSAKWAIVTSGTAGLAEAWIKLMGLPRPDVFVTADDVVIGKPNPEGYLLARKRLGLSETADSPADVLVVEDAPAGIRAGKAAGCDVLALLTTHSREEIDAARPDLVANHLGGVEWLGKDEYGILLLINPSPPPSPPGLLNGTTNGVN